MIIACDEDGRVVFDRLLNNGIKTGFFKSLDEANLVYKSVLTLKRDTTQKVDPEAETPAEEPLEEETPAEEPRD